MENKNSKKNLRDTDVLIINDIYAVGLKYDKAIKSSPFVTYKSKNVENCKLIANKHSIPIYKNNIANDLYVLNVKESIPENMYHSIAQIFAEITVNSKNNFENLLDDAIFYANFETSLVIELKSDLLKNLIENNFPLTIENLRKEVISDLGLVIPPIKIVENNSLAFNSFVIKLNKNILKEELLPKRNELIVAEALIIESLKNIINENAGMLITRRQIFQMFEKLDSQIANYSSKILQDVSINTIHAVLSNLLEEQVPILEIEKILETLCIYNGENENIIYLTEQVRKSLSTTICERLVSPNGSLLVIQLSTDIEEKIAKIINKKNKFCEATFLKNLITSIKNENNGIETDYGQIPTILCSSAIRSYMRMITKMSCRNPILSYEELNTNKNEAFKVKEIGLISETKKITKNTFNSNKINIVSTGFDSLDKALNGGFCNTDLIVLGARPAMGKTSLGLNIAENIGLNQNKPVLIFSLEMSTEQLTRRLISTNSMISNTDLRKGNLNKKEWGNIANAMDKFANSKIYIDDKNSLTIEEMYSKSKELKLVEKDLALIIVDYLQLMKTSKQDQCSVEIATISRGLKNLSREIEVPILCLSQLSRAIEYRDDKRPNITDFRESEEIAQQADKVLFLYRDDYYEPDNDKEVCEAEIIIAKNRHNPIISPVKLAFHKNITKFEDIK